jgi:hypothetical protein
MHATSITLDGDGLMCMKVIGLFDLCHLKGVNVSVGASFLATRCKNNEEYHCCMFLCRDD